MHPAASRGRRRLGTTALVAVLAVMAAACGGSPKAASKAGDPVQVIASLNGRGTTVTLNPNTIQKLTKLGVKVTPFGTAQASRGGSLITFPITSGYAEVHGDKAFKPSYVMGSVEHAGSGLTFTRASQQVTVANFVVDPGDSVVYASLGGTNGVPLLTLDDTNLKASTQGPDMTLDGMVAALTPAATTALNRTFATTTITAGLPLGSVHMVASGPRTSYSEAQDRTIDISRASGQVTSVQLDPTTLQALKQIGMAVTPTGTTTFDRATSTLSLPINGGIAIVHSNRSARPGPVDGVLLHQGSGLKFSLGDKSVVLANFILDPGHSALIAGLGNRYGQFATLDDTSLHVSEVGGTVHLDGALVRLTPLAAQVLDRAFGRAAVTPGLLLGTAHTVISRS